MYSNCPERQSLDFYFVKASATVIFTVIISYFYTHFTRKWSIRDAYIIHPTENVSSIHLYRSHLDSIHLRYVHFCNNYTKVSLRTVRFKPSSYALSTNPAKTETSSFLSEPVSLRRFYYFHPTSQSISYTLIHFSQRQNISSRHSFL